MSFASYENWPTTRHVPRSSIMVNTNRMRKESNATPMTKAHTKW